MDKKEAIGLRVGGLLYTPAVNRGVAERVLNEDWPCLTSLSLCLEDAIQDSGLAAAEKQLQDTLSTLRRAGRELPLIFIRVRNPRHFLHVHRLLGAEEEIVCGYIFPKFDETNAPDYLSLLRRINAGQSHKLFAMPIIESRSAAFGETRRETLSFLRSCLGDHQDAILNVRVGGNDFCNLFGLRRNVTQSIYDLGPVRDILIDILNWFSMDYIVSGPVWEYYGEDAGGPWAEGLKRELALDQANGFLGKTAIHPSQLPLIYESLQVSPQDLADAEAILNWKDGPLAVAGSANGGRMNEVKCHTRWAKKIAARAKLYGVREAESHGDRI